LDGAEEMLLRETNQSMTPAQLLVLHAMKDTAAFAGISGGMETFIDLMP